MAKTEKRGMTESWRDTLFLPQTDFPMRAALPEREGAWLAQWEGLYERLDAESKTSGAPFFELHDGPPYANGHLHIGHALNKILKDFITRSHRMLGYHARYVPGWDCHGLPIEWKVEEGLRARGLSKDDVPISEMRAECRAFAARWIAIQREEFKRLGVSGDWGNRYATMDHESERAIAAEFLKFVMNGTLYRGFKPVMWSPVEKTALADAEVEYHERESHTVYVKFPVTGGAGSDLIGASVLIWTTTPWTLPSNRGVVYGEGIDYGLYEVQSAPEGNWLRPGERLLIADARAEEALTAARVCEWQRLADAPDMRGLALAHPWRGAAWARGEWDYAIDFRAAPFVDAAQGTGFVHCAPSHGLDEYEMYRDLGMLDRVVTWNVDEAGVFAQTLPRIGGLAIIRADGGEGPANEAVIAALAECGALAARGRVRHSYPHSWRSRAPVIYRNTAQWFIAVDKPLEDGTSIRERALASIDRDVRWIPPAGRNRLYAMVAERPDWVISRQRVWGVPLCCFINRRSGALLRDEAVNARILETFGREGADAWFREDAAAQFLGAGYRAEEWEKIDDILDVWFESGATHAFVLEAREGSRWPASIYLEGSDQHRGWFHSSLLEACGTRGRAPYETVLTHGFTLDEKGEKMSKSRGNTIAPQDVVAQYGADILRLWVAQTDYTADQRIGPEILKGVADSYRRLRNSMRFLLGNLSGWKEAERLEFARMPFLERWVLHRLAELDALSRKSYESFAFQKLFAELFNFCTVDLSSLYFDIRKDALYCDGHDSPRRRAARTVLDATFARLATWLAPVLCFTMEEVWLSRYGDAARSVHAQRFPATPDLWRDEAIAAQWTHIRSARRVATGAIEIARKEKRFGASLEAGAAIHCADPAMFDALTIVDMAEICIVSEAEILRGEGPEDAFRLDDMPGIAVTLAPARGEKCPRCWRILPETTGRGLCGRCALLVEGQARTAAPRSPGLA